MRVSMTWPPSLLLGIHLRKRPHLSAYSSITQEALRGELVGNFALGWPSGHGSYLHAKISVIWETKRDTSQLLGLSPQ